MSRRRCWSCGAPIAHLAAYCSNCGRRAYGHTIWPLLAFIAAMILLTVWLLWVARS